MMKRENWRTSCGLQLSLGCMFVFRFVMCFSSLLILIKFLFIVAYDFGLCSWSQIKSVVGLGFFVNGCDCVIYVQVKFWVSGVIGPSFLWMVDFVTCLHSSTWLCRVSFLIKKLMIISYAWSYSCCLLEFLKSCVFCVKPPCFIHYYKNIYFRPLT